MLFFILIINWHAEGALSRSFELALLVNHKIAFNLKNIENRNSLLKVEKCQIYTKYEQGWRRLYDSEKFRRNVLRFTNRDLVLLIKSSYLLGRILDEFKKLQMSILY